MIIKVSCECCANEDLIISDSIIGFYCSCCDEHISMNNVDIEEIEEEDTDAMTIINGGHDGNHRECITPK